jgi:parvulin-like peptidyl-prolyl isomerase
MYGMSHRSLAAVAIILLFCPSFAAGVHAEILATVNGSEITGQQLDRVLLRGHDTSAMGSLAAASVRDVLNKAIDDELLWQDAQFMEFDRDANLVAEMEKLRTQSAIARFVEKDFVQPATVPEADVRDFFERHYFKVLLRQLSVLDATLAASFKVQIGASPSSMESLIREYSVDARSVNGGLHNEKYWADVEEVIRENVADLKVGQVSAPFPYKNAYSLVRVEKRGSVDEEAFESKEASIRSLLLGRAKDAAWLEYSRLMLEETPVELVDGMYERLKADSDVVFRGEFRSNSTEVALRLNDEIFLTEGQLRKAISHAAMEEGTTPFDEILEKTVRREGERLALALRAKEAGYFDDPELIGAYEQKLRESVIGFYLEQVIVPEITFRREEFQRFYDENLDRFRPPPEVKIEMLLLNSEEDAKEVEQRLGDGADFQYVKKLFAGPHASASSDVKWASIELFSDDIRSELERLSIGESSKAIELPSGWMVFRLENKRKGTAKTLEEADPTIRQVMYKEKFQALVKRHLALLKERSDIVYDEDAIANYANASE